MWFASVLPHIIDKRCGVQAPLGSRLGRFAMDWPELIGRSLLDYGGYYYMSFVGHYGWGGGPKGDLHFPLAPWMYWTGLAMLGFAIWQALTASVRLTATVRIWLTVSAAASVLLTFLAMYVTCTGQNQMTVAGVQGRYFVPPLFALAGAVGGLLATRAPGVQQRFYVMLLSAWVIACTVAMLRDASRLYGHLA